MAERVEEVVCIEFKVSSLLYLPHAPSWWEPVVLWEMSILIIRASQLTVVMGDLRHSMAPPARLRAVKVVKEPNRIL
jgi:hypothetical protein